MPTAEINYLAVLIGAVISMVLGSIWYAPSVFGNGWMAAVGKKASDVNKSKVGPMYALTVIIALILSYVMAHFVDYVGATDWMEGAQTGFWAWLGFVATSYGVTLLFEGKPFKLFAINAGYHLVEFVLIGALLAHWV